MVPLNEAGGLLGKLLRCPTSMTHSMVTGQSMCQTAEQAYNSQTDRDVGVSTLASQDGREELRGDILHTNWTTGPLVGSVLCTLALGTQGVAHETPFMRGYPSKACGILLSSWRCFLHFVFKARFRHVDQKMK